MRLLKYLSKIPILSNTFIKANVSIVDVTLELKYPKLLEATVCMEVSYSSRVPRIILPYAAIVMKNPLNQNCWVNLVKVDVIWEGFMRNSTEDDQRQGIERRQFSFSAHVPERRTGRDRRCVGCRTIIRGKKEKRSWFSDRLFIRDYSSSRTQTLRFPVQPSLSQSNSPRIWWYNNQRGINLPGKLSLALLKTG